LSKILSFKSAFSATNTKGKKVIPRMPLRFKYFEVSKIMYKCHKFAVMKEQNNENKLMEGEDFYLTPEGYKCFTEKHHLKRGYCCKSGCRHCPYGFDKKTNALKKKK
jgi:hypothetical protein